MVQQRATTAKQAPTPTIAAAPAALTDVKKPSDGSRKWKTVPLTLTAIVAAMLVLGLSVCLCCWWFVGELLDDHP